MKFLRYLLYFCAISFLNAQEYAELPQVIPASPDAASLMKFTETPVSLEAGIPQINIPIYKVENRDIQIPISLSYHAGGIKVEEIASWVGLGWSLNAGGAISRTVQGLPDDKTNGFIHTTHTVEEFNSLSHSVYGENRYYQIEQMNYGYRDYEADIFNFNFLGYSGRFIYDQATNKFHQTQYSNIDIETLFDINLEIEGFVLTTPDGVKYYFGQNKAKNSQAVDFNSLVTSFSYNQHNYSISDSGPTTNYINTWYLKEIVSPSGNKQELNYVSGFSGSILYKTQESLLPDNTCSAKGYSASFTEITSNPTQIDNISFPGGSIKFVRDSSTRLDLGGGYALSSIEIYKGTELHKKFKLNHSYFISPEENGRWTSLGDAQSRRYRLKLESVQEFNAENYSKPPYDFTYNSTQLPSRFSNAQDYWGYYNGKTDNYSLIPIIRTTGSTAIYYGDADRTVDTIASKAGMLTEIKYPTGGSSKYFYESNTASNLILKGGDNYDIRNREEDKYLNFNNSPGYYNSSSGLYEAFFTISSGVSGQIEITTSVTGCDNSQTLNNFECDFILEIKGITDPMYSTNISSSSMTFEIPPGDYKITAMEAGLGLTQNPSFNSSLHWKEISESQSDYTIVGGQRIKKIIYNDGQGDVVEKNYNYDYFNQSLTSGYMISTPVFVDPEYFNGSCSPSKDVYKITSNSQAPNVNIGGSSVGYTNVTELNNNLLKTEYTFNTVGDYAHFGSGSFGEIILPDLNVNWLRGNLVKKEEFKFANNNYTLLRSTVYERESVGRYSIANHGVKVVPTIGSSGIFTFKYGFYSGLSEWYRDKKVTTTEYFDSGSLVTEKSFFYERNNSLLPSRIETVVNSGKKVSEDIFYTDDVTSKSILGYDALTDSEFSAINQLKSNHRINSAIQRSTEVRNSSGLLLSEITNRNLYKDYNGIVSASSVETSKNSLGLEPRIQHHDYDSSGNPLEVSKEDGAHIIYLWGYNDQFPIAKIENATSSEVSPFLGTLSTVDESDFPAINGLRTNLPNAMVTTYEYEPLVGITKITDPKGLETTYHYDTFNRLEFIKDDQGNLIEEYKYNYKN